MTRRKRCPEKKKKRKLTCDLDQKMKTSPTILKSSSASGSGQVSHLALQAGRETTHMAAHDFYPKKKKKQKPTAVRKPKCRNVFWWPVVVHIADQQRVQSIQVPAEHRKLIPDGPVFTVDLRLAFHSQLILLGHHLARSLLQLLHGGDEVRLEHLWFGPTNDGLGEHCRRVEPRTTSQWSFSLETIQEVFYPPLTCQPLHPRGLVDTQVVHHDLHDAPQQLVKMLRGDGGAQLTLLLREVLGAPLPPAWEVVAQHGQRDLNHMGHLRVAGARLGQVVDLLHQNLQLRDVGAKLLHLAGETQNWEETRELQLRKNNF